MEGELLKMPPSAKLDIRDPNLRSDDEETALLLAVEHSPAARSKDLTKADPDAFPELEDHCKHFDRVLALAEMAKQSRLAAPIAAMNFLWFMRSIVSTIYLGHLGGLDLAGGAMAITMANLTGYSFLVGLASGMEPIVSQAYGAKKFLEMGDALQRAIVILLLASVPVAVLWWYMEDVFVLLGQDPAISGVAGRYLIYQMPDLALMSVIYPVRVYLRSQSITFPMMCCAAVTLVLHIPLNYVCIQVLGLGFRGAAIATWVSDAFLLVFLVAYIRISGIYKHSWRGWSAQVCFQAWGPFLRLAAPSCAAICLEWWCSELMLLISGRLADPTRDVAAMSICLNLSALAYMFPYALSSAVSTRVGNELGANCPYAARLAMYISGIFGFSGGVGIAVILVLFRNQVAGLFTSDVGVTSMVAGLVPLVALMVLGDCPQTALQGVLRGSARPTIGVFVNLASYYLVGFPSALLFAFYFQLGVHGLWMGLALSQAVQVVAVSLVVLRTNWEHQALRSQEWFKVDAKDVDDMEMAKRSTQLQLDHVQIHT